MPANATDLAKDYLARVKDQLVQLRPDVVICNMDESPMWFDLPSTATVDFQGVRTVSCKTTGAEKLRFTVAPTILSNGKSIKCYSMINDK